MPPNNSFERTHPRALPPIGPSGLPLNSGVRRRRLKTNVEQKEMMNHRKHHESNFKLNFVRQQGFNNAQPQTCALQFSALLFQPRLVGLWSLLGVVFQSSVVFLTLSATLWWCALFPQWNPFEHLYNATFGSQLGALRLGGAPAPRRFAQGMAATFSLAIGTLLMFEQRLAACALEALLLLAVGALVFGGFCLGSFIFHVITGRSAFARHTLPWGPGA